MANGFSASSLSISGASARTFMSLIAGHLLFVAGLAAVIQYQVDRGNIWITPLFGLPWLILGPKDRFWQKALFVIVALTAVHYLAVEVAVRNPTGTPSSWWLGAISGAIGGAASLLIAALLALLRRDSQTLMLAVIGTVLLTVLGAIGVHMFLAGGGADADGQLLDFLWIYTPWQIGFAYVLATLLRTDAEA